MVTIQPKLHPLSSSSSSYQDEDTFKDIRIMERWVLPLPASSWWSNTVVDDVTFVCLYCFPPMPYQSSGPSTRGKGRGEERGRAGPLGGGTKGRRWARWRVEKKDGLGNLGAHLGTSPFPRKLLHLSSFLVPKEVK